MRSRTGKVARKWAASMPRTLRERSAPLAPADGPLAGAGLRVERGGAAVLLGLRRLGRVARAADGLPRRQRELVLAVEAVAGVGARVAARLAGGDRLQRGGGRRARRDPAVGGGVARRAQLVAQVAVVAGQLGQRPAADRARVAVLELGA